MKRPKLLLILIVVIFLSKMTFGLVSEPQMFTKADTGLLQKGDYGKQIRDALNKPLLSKGLNITNGPSDAFGALPEGYKKDLLKPLSYTGFVSLTSKDKENYILSIDQHTIVEWKDTVCFDGQHNRPCIYSTIAVSLLNKSADTLKYINMSCSWLDAFIANAKNVHIIPKIDCYKNGPAIFTVLPFQTVKFYIPILFFLDADRRNMFTAKNFKIGMRLCKYFGNNQLRLFNQGYVASDADVNSTIWSNEVLCNSSN